MGTRAGAVMRYRVRYRTLPRPDDYLELTPHERAAIVLRRTHIRTWRERGEGYWLARLMGEVGELASSLAGDHDDPPDWELLQIAAICLNWLEARAEVKRRAEEEE